MSTYRSDEHEESGAGVPRGLLRLSPAAHIRVVGEDLVVESALSRGRLSMPSAAVLALVYALRRPTTIDSLVEGQDATTSTAIAGVVSQLYRHGFVVPCAIPTDGSSDTESRLALSYWDFHDLMFHSKSRLGWNHEPVGGTYRFGPGDLPGPVAKSYPGGRVPLPAPDMEALAASDPPFSDVVEGRRSVREFGREPLSLAQLGEFLYRTARVQEERGGRRPYPSGGSAYPLEVYVLVAACEGLASGAYHYDALGHALSALDADPAVVRDLQEGARSAISAESPPPVTLCLTARIQRVAFKYESIAYSLILKEVGGLYQTFWLAASAMGLAACGIGVGDSERVAALTGADPYVEPAVGEFVIGPLPT